MARKSRQSFLKRQREARRAEKAALKRQKRMERRRRNPDDEPGGEEIEDLGGSEYLELPNGEGQQVAVSGADEDSS